MIGCRSNSGIFLICVLFVAVDVNKAMIISPTEQHLSTRRVATRHHTGNLFLADSTMLADFSPSAAALFNNMKTPASILAAGMVSLGFLAPFRLSPGIQEQPELLRRIELLKLVYIVVTLICFCSELLAVMWATVAVNQLTETVVAPTTSVWALLERDFDLEWAATNSHFVLG
jgi:hypothetical protein